ncbi:hypothetical protein B0H16DRAFT_1570434 [Mycena metata]|uniref:MYND-type domain-containing protein n=1 Tax=Mycena metata TaxID=1033252 RepID=A0AAD7IB69_9AGAR|nr:hypothetical protein B0H16DRAFT_1570434 [Mycena metata]
MHPALRRQNISKLPLPVRRIALAAADGSHNDLQMLGDLLCDSDFRAEPYSVHLLPAFYSNLDTSMIPTLDMIDDMVATDTVQGLAAVRAALISLENIGGLLGLPGFPQKTYPELWSCVWPWAHFVNAYWECLHLGDHTDASELHLSVVCAFLLLELRARPGPSDAILPQAGVRLILSKAWTALMHKEVVAVDRHRSELLLVLMSDVHIHENFQELVDGAGNLGRLAFAIIQEISVTLSEPPSVQTILALGLLPGFLSQTRGEKEWVDTLLSRGIITSLVSILRDVDKHMAFAPIASTGPRRDLAIRTQRSAKESCWDMIVIYATNAPDHLWVAGALQAGLLACVFDPLVKGLDHRMPELIKYFLGFLGTFLVFHSILLQMKTALIDTEQLSGDPRFIESALFADWTALVSLAKQRIVVLDEWEAAGRPSFRACDNMVCGKIDEKGGVQCCGACLSANYCSTDCQRADWQIGHREVCGDLRVERSRCLDSVCSRDRAFMRALVHHDYQRLLPSISMDQVKFMRRNLDSKEFVVVFNYHGTANGVTVKSRDECMANAEVTGYVVLEVGLNVQLDRMAQSDARMVVHALSGGPFIDVVRWVPLRMSSGAFQIGLRDIATSGKFEPGSKEENSYDEERVRELIAGTKDLVAIH